ncbi:MAG TPA: S9 family peptidase [Thermomicrobiales bacterium]|nr:S9 family peptidase [Thermomicrobiales bacterium]
MATTSTASETAAAPGTRRPVQPADLFRLTMIGDVAVSPDAQMICFVQTRMDREANAYRSALWMAPVGGMPGEAVRFTHGEGAVAQPRWSPNGRWLAFLSDRETTGKRQIWIAPTSGVGGEARRLTNGDTSVSDYAWAPDGTRLAIVRTETIDRGDDADEAPEGERVANDAVTITRIRNKFNGAGFINDRRSHLWTVDLEGHETRLTGGDHDNSAPDWSPDCQSIVFVGKRDPDADYTNVSDLWVVPAAGGEPRRLTGGAGPVDAPTWSPDGATIAYVGSDRARVSGANSDLWLIPADGSGPARNLSGALDLSIGLQVGSDSRAGLSALRPVWAPDGGALYAVASTRGDTPLWRFPLDGEPSRVIGGAQQVQSFSLCAAGTTLALNLGDNLNPGDVYCARCDGANLRQLTDANGAFFAEVELVGPEQFTYAGADGWEVAGWLMKPAGFEEGRKYPLILEIHGGPHAAYGNTFFFEFQVLAGQGWGVLFANPRGSTTYGERFTMASNDDWGGKDYQDLMAGVDAAIARAPWIDPARLGVTGGSFGGYMTNWIVTQTDRFKAAVTQRSICNMVSKWGTSDIGYIGNDEQWGGPPWENLQFYLDRSPLMHVKNVVTPLLIIHSERDLRCPMEQAEQFFTALKYLGREVELVRFPDESHELSRSGQPLHRLERLQRIVGWFKRVLSDEC